MHMLAFLLQSGVIFLIGRARVESSCGELLHFDLPQIRSCHCSTQMPVFFSSHSAVGVGVAVELVGFVGACRRVREATPVPRPPSRISVFCLFALCAFSYMA